MTHTGSSLSYQDELGYVTLANTNFTNPTISISLDSTIVTAALIFSPLVIVIVVGIILLFWCIRRIWRNREYMRVQILNLNTLSLFLFFVPLKFFHIYLHVCHFGSIAVKVLYGVTVCSDTGPRALRFYPPPPTKYQNGEGAISKFE